MEKYRTEMGNTRAFLNCQQIVFKQIILPKLLIFSITVTLFEIYSHLKNNKK